MLLEHDGNALTLTRVVDGEAVQFAKAQQSHWEGTECLYVGRAADGTVRLFESDSPNAMITTSSQKLVTFAKAVVAGEFPSITG